MMRLAISASDLPLDVRIGAGCFSPACRPPQTPPATFLCENHRYLYANTDMLQALPGRFDETPCIESCRDREYSC